MQTQPISVTSPCRLAWDDLQGSQQVRRCAQCDRDVANLVAMTEREIQVLIGRTGGRFCANVTYRPDGTLLTLPEPSRFPWRHSAATVLVSIASLVASAPAQTVGPLRSATPAAPQADTPSAKPLPAAMKSAPKAGLSVTVVDATGAVVPAVTVTLQLPRGPRQQVASDDDGTASWQDVTPGDYSLEVQAPGFQTWRLPVTVRPGEAIHLTATLAIGMMGEVVVLGPVSAPPRPLPAPPTKRGFRFWK